MSEEQKHAEIFNIVDQNSLVGPSRTNSLIATPDRIFKKTGGANPRVLHNGTKTDLLLQFSSVTNVDDCTPEWIHRNREIFAASFARKCLRNLFANKEAKLNRILAVECGKQRVMRRERKFLMTSMAPERRVEQKAKYRFLRTAVNSPLAPKTRRPESEDSAARMLISEFEILMRQFGVQFFDKAELESVFEAVKDDKPGRNYITLDQFLAWYREHSFPTKGVKKVAKWKSLTSGSYDLSMARLSVIQYCIQAALEHGSSMFIRHFEDYRTLSTCASPLLLPPTPTLAPTVTPTVTPNVTPNVTPHKRIVSGEQKVETPPPLALMKRLSASIEPDPPSTAAAAAAAAASAAPAPAVHRAVPSEESVASAAETEDEFDTGSHKDVTLTPAEQTVSFDAAAYIEAACQEFISPVHSSEDEHSSDYDVDSHPDDDNEPRTSMSDGARALIDSLLVFSEDGMDEIATHIEANRDDDHLAEEEIESFIGNLADEAMTTFAERLELP